MEMDLLKAEMACYANISCDESFDKIKDSFISKFEKKQVISRLLNLIEEESDEVKKRIFEKITLDYITAKKRF